MPKLFSINAGLSLPLRKPFLLYLCPLLFLAARSFSQDSSSSFSVSAYADAYIAFYTDSLGPGEYQKFPTVSPRSEQFGLNIAQVSAKYSGKIVRGVVTLQYGDIPKSSWSTTFNFIQEANVGIRICKNLWFDGGFFRTHIGTEALLPKENYTSSIAVLTYYEPFYQAGFRLNYNPNDKLSLFLYLLNGYNLYEDNNKKKSLGVLATYAVNDKINFGYDNYLGDDSPVGDSISRLRFYNNLFLNLKFSKVKITAGSDFCMQAHSQIEDADKTAAMINGLFILSYDVAKKSRIYGRTEFFNDSDGCVSGIFPDNKNQLAGLKLWGFTLGGEYKPTENSYIRVEGRELVANDAQKIFYWNGENKNTRFEAMLNFGVWFPQ